VAIVGGICALGTGLERQVGEWADVALGWDLFVRHPTGVDAQLLDRIVRIPGVLRASPVVIRSAEVMAPNGHGVHLSLFGIRPGAYAEDKALLSSRAGGEALAQAILGLADRSSALVSEIVAEQLGIRPGSQIELKTPAGPKPLKIRATLVDYAQSGYAVIVDESLLRELFGVPHADVVTVRVKPSAQVAQVAQELGQIPMVRLETRAQIKARVLRLIAQAASAMDGLLWLAAWIGLLAVGATIAQGAIERRADIASLRSLGMSRKQVTTMLLAEALLLAALGVAVGFLLGLFLAFIFVRSTHALGMSLGYVPPWRALLFASLAVTVAAIPSALLPARAAARIPPAEAFRVLA
jgi:putative ABC transport system permease protein